MEENQNINQPVQNPNPIPSPAATPPIPEAPKPKSKLPLFLLVILLILFLAGGAGAAYMLVLQPKPQEPIEEKRVAEAIPSPTPDPTANLNTSNWNTYTGKYSEVSFKHPADWKVEESDGQLLNDAKVNYLIKVYDPDKDRSLRIIKSFYGGIAGMEEAGNKEIIIDGYNVTKYYHKQLGTDEQAYGGITSLIKTGKDNYMIFFDWNNNDQTESDEIFDTILASIKFTAPVASASPQPSQTDNPNNNKRKTDVTRIVNAIGAYTADNKGTLPNEITLNSQIISKGGADLCSKLVPQYISALPVDPLTNNGEAITDCSGDYFTNYSINKNPENTITVSAPAAELGEIIWITR